MKYKLLVADFDDTTVDDSLVISDKVKDSILKYVKNGGFFTFCTGRMTESIINYARELGLKGQIMGYQGAEVADIQTGEILYQNTISKESALYICDYLDKTGEYYQLYHGGNFYVEKDCLQARDYEMFTGIKMNVTNSILSDFVNKNNIEPLKIMLRINPKDNEKYIADFSVLFGHLVNINTSKQHLIEIVDKQVDKGIAVRDLCKRLKISREDTVCIGDSLSDVPMIKFAGLGVCVSNGLEIAKKAASLIVPSCAEGGLSFLIENYCL
jgi:hypothetical protein